VGGLADAQHVIDPGEVAVRSSWYPASERGGSATNELSMRARTDALSTSYAATGSGCRGWREMLRCESVTELASRLPASKPSANVLRTASR
jgi:hypothetical protein